VVLPHTPPFRHFRRNTGRLLVQKGRGELRSTQSRHDCSADAPEMVGTKRVALLWIAPLVSETSASAISPRARNGCSGWSRTNTSPLNKRANYCYSTEHLKLVGMAGFSPAASRSQAGSSED
jgi:hypothetical protein